MTYKKTLYKKGNLKLYQFINTPEEIAKVLFNCNLQNLATHSRMGAVQCFGDDPDYPEVIHIYESSTPKVTDPYRLFIIEKVKFQYREIT
jgi:hypothetical protein